MEGGSTRAFYPDDASLATKRFGTRERRTWIHWGLGPNTPTRVVALLLIAGQVPFGGADRCNRT
jgi:hypothetical protein